MSEPYIVGRPGNRGIRCFSDGEAHALLKEYHALGYQLAIHAIGDDAIEQVLSGIENAGTPDNPIAGRRHRIEHCGFLTHDQFDRMRKAGIYPVPQPVFIYEFGDLYVTNVGSQRAAHSYPMKDWLDAGMMPAASSDAPVCTTNPFINIYTMLTRRTRAGTPIGPQQALSIEEALHAYTYCGAFSQFAENEVGRLLPGMRADIAILSDDIFSMSPEAILEDLRFEATLLGGEVVHGAAKQYTKILK
jgi:predicted amidohydrolase YtcJ